MGTESSNSQRKNSKESTGKSGKSRLPATLCQNPNINHFCSAEPPRVAKALFPPIADAMPKALDEHLPRTSEMLPSSSGDSEPATRPLVAVSGPLADPFAGFGGHSFLRFCKLLEWIAGWRSSRSNPTEITAESILNSPVSSQLKYWGSCSLGTIWCALAAAVLIPLFYASSIKSLLPLPFLIIVALIAVLFGRAAGVLGTIAAAFLFAYFLFEPSGLGVSDPSARNHLIWMLIIGVVISDLVGRFKMHGTRSHRL